MRTLVVRMDDLGYSEGVNCGIAKAATGGVARTVGVMANMPWAESGLELLRETLAREGRSLDDLAVGVHANISNGAPLAGPDGGTAVYIDHPGYVDEYLMAHSSLNLERIHETALLTSPSFKAWLDENDYKPATIKIL